QITQLQLELLRSTSVGERKRILEDLFDAEQKRALEVNSVAPKIIARPITISELRHVLHSDELLIEYVLGDKDSYCLAVTRSSARLLRLKIPRREVEGNVEAYLDKVRKKKDSEGEERSLYKALLAPIPGLTYKARLIVVPDGSLNLLPFDALRGDDARYVLFRHVVTYSPSATVVHLLRTKRQKAARLRPFLGIGDVTHIVDRQLIAQNANLRKVDLSRGFYDLAGASFAELPGSRRELSYLCR